MKRHNILSVCTIISDNVADDWRTDEKYKPPPMNDVSEWDQSPRTRRRSAADDAVDKVVDFVNSVQLSAATARRYSYR
jgi:hypothetical protein